MAGEERNEGLANEVGVVVEPRIQMECLIRLFGVLRNQMLLDPRALKAVQEARLNTPFCIVELWPEALLLSTLQSRAVRIFALEH
jgi:hypothetical protein